MPRRVRRWLALPAHERRMFLLLALLQPGISMGLRWFGFKRTHEWLTDRFRRESPRQATTDELREAQRLAELAKLAGRHGLSRTTCLRQSLAVHMLLLRRGLGPQLKLGVDRVGATPDMHAWVELDGHALAQPGMRHAAFVETASRKHSDTQATTSDKRE